MRWRFLGPCHILLNLSSHLGVHVFTVFLKNLTRDKWEKILFFRLNSLSLVHFTYVLVYFLEQVVVCVVLPDLHVIESLFSLS